jgi:hypothetical protein
VTEAHDASHPDALAIYCSDGRFTRAVERLLAKLGHHRLDTMTLPGGPALLSPWPADLSEVHIFTRAAHFLIDAHRIKHAVLLAHEACGFYRARSPRIAEAELQKRQIENLQSARKVLEQEHPDLDVACYYARVVNGKVEFEKQP